MEIWRGNHPIPSSPTDCMDEAHSQTGLISPSSKQPADVHSPEDGAEHMMRLCLCVFIFEASMDLI